MKAVKRLSKGERIALGTFFSDYPESLTFSEMEAMYQSRGIADWQHMEGFVPAENFEDWDANALWGEVSALNFSIHQLLEEK